MTDDDPPHAFQFYGGKATHLDFILPNLPASDTYVEPFGGSAAVLLAREPSPVEVYNDIDGDLVTFFRVLRDRPDDLVRELRATPYARAEYDHAIEVAGDQSVDDLERARCFFIRANQVYSGLAQYATPGRWSYSVTESTDGKSGVVNSWLGKIDDLERVAQRIHRVQLECDDAVAVIDRYDDPQALIYADPPYPFEVRGKSAAGKPVAYGSELDAETFDHERLADALTSADADVAVSSYRSDRYDALFDGWHVVEGTTRTLATKHTDIEGDRPERTEVLYCNYDPDAVVASQQTTLAGIE